MTKTKEILARLYEVEQKHDVGVLHAIESGSRAWGFSSKDSDYDVRFIYCRKPEDYLTIFNDFRDTIDAQDEPIENDIDLVGFDLKKALQLLYKSNPTVIEWANSDIFYSTVPGFYVEFHKLAQECYNPRAAWHHYASMAKGNWYTYLNPNYISKHCTVDGRVNYKKYLYVIRPLLACRWIERNPGIPIPTLFDTLVKETIAVRCLILDEVDKLVKQKSRGFEQELLPRNQILDSWCTDELNYLSKSEPPAARIGGSKKDLDTSFLKIINQVKW